MTRLEVGRIQRVCLLKAINMSIYFVASRIILFVCFITFVLTGNILTANAVFVTMSLFNAVRNNLTLILPLAISSGAELSVSCTRIQVNKIIDSIKTIEDFLDFLRIRRN